MFVLKHRPPTTRYYLKVLPPKRCWRRLLRRATWTLSNLSASGYRVGWSTGYGDIVRRCIASCSRRLNTLYITRQTGVGNMNTVHSSSQCVLRGIRVGLGYRLSISGAPVLTKGKLCGYMGGTGGLPPYGLWDWIVQNRLRFPRGVGR